MYGVFQYLNTLIAKDPDPPAEARERHDLEVVNANIHDELEDHGESAVVNSPDQEARVLNHDVTMQLEEPPHTENRDDEIAIVQAAPAMPVVNPVTSLDIGICENAHFSTPQLQAETAPPLTLWNLPVPNFEGLYFKCYKDIVVYGNRFCAGRGELRSNDGSVSSQFAGYGLSISKSYRLSKDKSKPFDSAVIGCILGKVPNAAKRSHQGTEVDSELPTEFKRARNRASVACECPFKIHAKLDPSRNEWVAKTVVSHHNHPPLTQLSAKLRKPAFSDLTADQRLVLRECSLAEAKSKIFSDHIDVSATIGDIRYMKQKAMTNAVLIMSETLQRAKMDAVSKGTARNGIVVTFTNAFRPPSAERYLELVKVCNSKVGSFGNIQKPPFDATLTNKQHRKFLKAADYYGTSKRGVGACLAAVWDPTPIVKIIRKVFNLATIGPGYIWKIAPLGVQATHQDDKRFAKKIEQSSKQQLENQSFRDWHWVAFGALNEGQYIRVACEGDPDQLTSYSLPAGSLTFQLTNTWHAGDKHDDESLESVILFIDSEGRPVESDIQRYWNVRPPTVTDNFFTANERKIVKEQCGLVEIHQVEM